MAKKDDKKPTKKRRMTPESVATLQADLEDLTTRAEIAEDLETDLVAANEKIKALQNDLAKANAQIARLMKTAPLTADDEARLQRAKARIQFDQNFKTGKFFIRFKGTAPHMKRDFLAADLVSMARTLREIMK